MKVAESMLLLVEVMTQPALGSQTAVNRMPAEKERVKKATWREEVRRTVEKERPMSENKENERDDDVPFLRPYSHAR